MRGCYSDSSANLGHLHIELYWLLVDISSIRADGSSSRCHPCPYECAGVKAEKTVLSPAQRTIYLGVVWDSTMMQAHLSPAHIKLILAAMKKVRLSQSLTVKQFQRLLGLMAAASNMIPFGLLYMRPLQWFRTKEFSSKSNTLCIIKVTQRYLHTLVMWKNLWFLAPCWELLVIT